MLDRLSLDDRKHLMKHLKPVRLEPGQVFYERCQPLTL
jgi:hypothetical protein